jgi:asparagine synthase (glutamine-hydrolysing)
MCGILFTNNPLISEELFIKSLKLLGHRGPDAIGYLNTSEYKFGHTRLKILDLHDRSNQPFISRDGRYIIIFNGEIYNYLELANKYKLDTLITKSDTEVIVELFVKYGPKSVSWLSGMFSLVIYDKNTSKLFVARDRLGVKPLYIYNKCGRIVISSEMGALLELVQEQKIDEIGLRQYLKLRTYFNQRTLYQDVKMFPPGSFLYEGKLVRFWEISASDQLPPNDEELRSLIENSINQRLISDVPVGSYLSGGVDSSIIAAVSKNPDTWTVGFQSQNEFYWAQILAKRLDSTHHEVLMDKDEFLPLAEMMIKKRCEPLSVPNEVLLYRMTQEVKTKNTVVLSGEGADEFFFGYDRIFKWAANEKNFDIKRFSELYSYGTHDDIEIIEDAIGPFMYLKKPIDIVSRFFQVAHLHGLLRRLDNSTMLCSVEARVPFVDDLDLIDRIVGIPYSYCNENNIVKSPLKRIFKNLLPTEIINRKKVGFPVNLDEIGIPNYKDGKMMDNWFQYNISVLLGNTIDLDNFKIKLKF